MSRLQVGKFLAGGEDKRPEGSGHEGQGGEGLDNWSGQDYDEGENGASWEDE